MALPVRLQVADAAELAVPSNKFGTVVWIAPPIGAAAREVTDPIPCPSPFTSGPTPGRAGGFTVGRFTLGAAIDGVTGSDGINGVGFDRPGLGAAR